jgi:prepilin peptidase CpaA
LEHPQVQQISGNEMQAAFAIDTGIYLAVAIVLVLAAIEDIRTRRISNRLSLVILALFAARVTSALVQEAGILDAAVWPLASALAVFMVGLSLFAVRLMGGGDVKLMAATALFAGPELGLAFILYVTVAGGFVALATLIYGKLQTPDVRERLKVPYGVAISAGGLWVCFNGISALSM